MDDSNIKSKEDRSRNEESLQLSKPSIKISGYQINTIEHIRKYALNTKNAIDKKALRSELDVTEIMTTAMDVPDEIRILLACGVGIVGIYGGKYAQIVQTLMEEGRLAYIVADSSIAYGTNVPINIVVVTKDFSDNHSINTIYQLISRAGRVGRSWMAEAFIDSTCADKMIHSIWTNDTALNVELVNLEALHKDIIDNCFDVDKALLQYLAEKKALEEKEELIKQEKIKKEQEELLKIKEQERIKLEQERAKLEELKLRRSGNGGNSRNTVQISNIVNQPPSNQVTIHVESQENQWQSRNPRRTPSGSANANPNPWQTKVPRGNSAQPSQLTQPAESTESAPVQIKNPFQRSSGGFQRKVPQTN